MENGRARERVNKKIMSFGYGYFIVKTAIMAARPKEKLRLTLFWPKEKE